MPIQTDPTALLVTGIQAAGKSTVGRLLAERFERGVFIDGDVIWKLVVAGGEDMTPKPGPEALRQLHLRYRAAAMLAVAYREAGFVSVCADNVYGPDIASFAESLGSPSAVIVLRPSVEAVVRRYRARGDRAYRGWDEAGVERAVRGFDSLLAGGPRIGLWIDSTDMTPRETVDGILVRWEEAVVQPGPPPAAGRQ